MLESKNNDSVRCFYYPKLPSYSWSFLDVWNENISQLPVWF